MRMACDAMNNTPCVKHEFKKTPAQVYASTNANVEMRYWQPIGCPAYVLKNELQGDKRIFHKWKDRARQGIYLGRSKQHATSVALVLNPETGLTSPQFHVKFDPNFETTDQLTNTDPSFW